MHLTAHPSDRHRLRRRAAAGFTLLEVIAAMALIMFLVGGVYGIADGTLRLSAAMSHARILEARLTSFTNQWRACLENLPPDAKLSSGEKSGAPCLLIENCGTPFAWSRAALAAAAVEFALMDSGPAGASLVIRHLKRPERATTGEDYVVIAELPLLEGLGAASWEFYDASADQWVAEWRDESRRPLFLKMKWTMMGGPASHEALFWIADGQPAPAVPPAAAPAT